MSKWAEKFLKILEEDNLLILYRATPHISPPPQQFWWGNCAAREGRGRPWRFNDVIY